MSTPYHELPTVRMPIAQLVPHSANARHGNVAVIVDSLRTLGQFRQVVANVGTFTGRPFELLAGHHLVQAAQELHWKEIAVTLVDVDDEMGRRILVADNRTSDLATYDDRLLLELLSSLPSLDGTGYDPGDLEALEAVLAQHGWEVDDKDLQDALDAADEDGWPLIKGKVAPALHRTFLQVPGDDDSERLVNLIGAWSP